MDTAEYFRIKENGKKLLSIKAIESIFDKGIEQISDKNVREAMKRPEMKHLFAGISCDLFAQCLTGKKAESFTVTQSNEDTE